MTSAAVRGGELVVGFEDGTVARLDIRRLISPHTATPDWARLTFDTYEIAVPSQAGSMEIPSSLVRALTDAGFNQHLAVEAADLQRRIGGRIQELRQKRGTGIAELAARTDLARETIVAIERGERAVDLVALQRIISALGCTLPDLVDDPAPATPTDTTDLNPSPLPQHLP